MIDAIWRPPDHDHGDLGERWCESPVPWLRTSSKIRRTP